MTENRRTTMKNVVTDADQAILQEKYEFIPTKKKQTSWQDRMVERYQSGLYKEYALADLSRPGKMGLRWRTKQEVLTGKGETACGSKACMATERLITLRVPFAYMEQGVSKMDIVKLRLCPKCEPFVTRKQSSRESQSSSKKTESEAEVEKQVTKDTRHDDSNNGQESNHSDEEGQSAQLSSKDKEERNIYDDSDDEDRRKRRKRKKKRSHESSDSRKSRHRRCQC